MNSIFIKPPKASISALISLCSTSFIMFGCASSSPRAARETNPVQPAVPVIDPAIAPVGQCETFDGKLPSAPNIRPGALKIFSNGQLASLCQVLTQTQRAVGIFQFAGIDCVSCRDSAKKIEAEFAANPVIKQNIVHVLVMTDRQSDNLTVEQFKRDFTSVYAPSAVTTQDNEAQNWIQLSPNPRLPSRPVVVVLSQTAGVLVINQPGYESQIVPAAQQLAQTFSGGSGAANGQP
jgi:hypothetical protein